ncbi:MAG: DUF881 domain-containing protein [Desulfitobacterium hafniense]|nr:DUF881 domain-containing protein [Desulfitobacterium hafniense]
MKNKLALPVTLVAIALGFLISVQLQTQKKVTEAEEIKHQRTAQIKSVMVNAQAENTSLKNEHKNLSAKLDQARKQGGTSPELLAQLDQFRMLDGTVAVQGPGINITIDDRKEHKAVFPLTIDDLLRIINTLKFAGAEAISLNGQRIVSSTSIVLSGSSTILVNQVPINKVEGVPYELLAIGNQDVLLDYVTKLEAEPLKSKGITVGITRKVVQIPSYKGGYSFKAAAAEESGKQ